MDFVKATNGQAKLTMSIYGPAGSGKTCTSLMFAEGLAKASGKRIAFVDTEEGSGYYTMPIPERIVHPEAFDFDVLRTRSLLDLLDSLKSLDPAKFSTIIIDSISHFWESAISAWDGKKTYNEVTKMEGVPQYAWGYIKAPFKELIRFLMNSPFHIIIVGRQKDDYKNEELVGVKMHAEKDTAYEPQMCFRMELRKSQNDSTISRIVMCVEKDRTSILQGKTVPNPTFETIKPHLQLLQTEQAQIEDPVQVAKKDSELLIQVEKDQKKEKDESEKLFTKFNTEMQVCTDLKTLDDVYAEMHTQKLFIKEPRKKILRATYKQKKEGFKNEKATTV